jgi:glycosyltransferase involved in cell wall biosynthesis
LTENLKGFRCFCVVSVADLRSETLQSQIAETIQFEAESYEKAPLFSLIIPVYNEEEIIIESLNVLRRFFGRSNCELIVFDDSSTDGTCAKLRSALALSKDSNMRLIRSSARIGKGGAIKNAVEKAKGETVLIMDADLSADLRSVPELLKEAHESGGLVIGERNTSDRSTQGFLRVMPSLIYNILVRALFRTGVRDHQCGFKAMKASTARKLMAGMRNDGFVFDTELIVLAQKLRVPVRRILVKWADNRPNKSNLKWVRTSFIMMKDLFMLKTRGLL